MSIQKEWMDLCESRASIGEQISWLEQKAAKTGELNNERIAELMLRQEEVRLETERVREKMLLENG